MPKSAPSLPTSTSTASTAAEAAQPVLVLGHGPACQRLLADCQAAYANHATGGGSGDWSAVLALDTADASVDWVAHVLAAQPQPQAVLCAAEQVDEALLAGLSRLAQHYSGGVLLFTPDVRSTSMHQALERGVHYYGLQGHAAHELPALVCLARVRQQQVQRELKALQEVSRRLQDRIAVDRAKGLLMRAQALPDDEAFTLLRSTAMNTNMRLGELAQTVVDSAVLAESLNRCGQLRMLSQRIVKLHWLQLAGVNPVQCKTLLTESVRWADGNLVFLQRHVDVEQFGADLQALQTVWQQLQSRLQRDDPLALDSAAEVLLQEADALTNRLESQGAARLQLLNVAGRQRMLSQRYAKYALLLGLGEATLEQRAHAGMASAKEAFEAALLRLNAAPLSSQAISDALTQAGVLWLKLVQAAQTAPQYQGHSRLEQLHLLCDGSEQLLTTFDQLSSQYEHSLQVLLG